MSELTYDEKQFYLHGKPFQILSGAMHYFRIVPEYWRDRLQKAKECGLNTVETVVCWNLHERREGCFDFTGGLNLVEYIRTAQQLGLYVILRPGPYICAEWDMGGLPSWLLQIPGIRVRCCHDKYLEKVRNYFNVLLPMLRPYYVEQGGNIIAMQLENEYGSYGDDREYLREINRIYDENEVTCLRFTSDGPGYFMLGGGTLEGCLATVNFGSNPNGNFELLKQFRKDQPAMCMEYWNGWFDHWYEEHHQRESAETAQVFEEIISAGHSVNLYMFHGGTNFGFYNGANYDQGLQPTVTSYDYNCPVSECGDLTPKYYEIHDCIERYLGRKLPLTVRNLPKRAFGEVKLTQWAGLWDNLDVLGNPIESSYPLTMEEMGLDFGYAVYCSVLEGPFENLELEIDGLHDRAGIFLDGRLAGIKENTGRRNDTIQVGLGFGEKTDLKILVENMGRVNYGGHILDQKGITGGVRIANRYHFGWKMYPVNCEDLSGLQFTTVQHTIPAFFKGTFEVEEPADTFVRPRGFCKGAIWINGRNIGRFYQQAGPQKTLYLPAPLLHKGMNEIIVLETDACREPVVVLEENEEL